MTSNNASSAGRAQRGPAAGPDAAPAAVADSARGSVADAVPAAAADALALSRDVKGGGYEGGAGLSGGDGVIERS
ncbi:hypothetical protein [Streptomyces sp. NPDC048516]|uniref:hypothetical protein n=1 Tax=Streptomyces sp. NPDC048516 TaxID=3365565 RepID=UPI00371EABAE